MGRCERRCRLIRRRSLSFVFLAHLARSCCARLALQHAAELLSTQCVPSFLKKVVSCAVVAVTGMLDVAYPAFYRAFTANFAFSFGLIAFERIKGGLKEFTTRTGGDNSILTTYEKLQGFFSIDEMAESQKMAQLVLEVNDDPSSIPRIEGDSALRLCVCLHCLVVAHAAAALLSQHIGTYTPSQCSALNTDPLTATPSAFLRPTHSLPPCSPSSSSQRSSSHSHWSSFSSSPSAIAYRRWHGPTGIERWRPTPALSSSRI